MRTYLPDGRFQQGHRLALGIERGQYAHRQDELVADMAEGIAGHRRHGQRQQMLVQRLVERQ